MLNRLFNHKSDAKDGLTQPQREAIVDVLHFCMYADNFIALSESKFIAAKVESFNWDPKISFEYYQNMSIGAVRAALPEPKKREQFLASVKQRLATAELRGMTFGLCRKLFAADGSTPDSELASLGEIRKALGV